MRTARVSDFYLSFPHHWFQEFTCKFFYFGGRAPLPSDLVRFVSVIKSAALPSRTVNPPSPQRSSVSATMPESNYSYSADIDDTNVVSVTPVIPPAQGGYTIQKHSTKTELSTPPRSPPPTKKCCGKILCHCGIENPLNRRRASFESLIIEVWRRGHTLF